MRERPAIIAIHAAIAHTDAVAVAYREIKSRSGEHFHAADALLVAFGQPTDPDQVRRLRQILGATSHVSYSGPFYTLSDGRTLLQKVERVAISAEQRSTKRQLA